MKLTGNRNLYNADCNTIFYNPELWQPEGGRYSTKAIHRFVEALVSGGVDTLLVNPNTQIAWHPSKAWPTVLDGYKRGDHEFVRGHAPNNPGNPHATDEHLDQMTAFLDLYLDLAEAGVDWVMEMIVACRQRQITPWASVRMNDTHGSAAPEASYFNCPLFKNPKNRLSGKLPNPKDKPFVWWIGLNYELQEVRDYFLLYIRDLVNNYNFAGMELDWTRHFPIFEMPVSQKNIDTVTGWISEIRALTRAREKQTGKPFPLGVRTLCDWDKSRSFGVDVKTLAREGLIDFVIAANFWHTAWNIPIDRLRSELDADITIYGASDAIANWLTVPSSAHAGVESHRYLSSSAPLLRANAAGQLALGADGIEQFNFFIGDGAAREHMEKKQTEESVAVRSNYKALQGIGNLDELRGKPKHYAFALLPTDWWMPPHVETPEQLPALIELGARQAFHLPMAREPLDRGLKLTLQILFEKRATPPELGVSFNGSWPTFDATPTSDVFFPIGPFKQFHPHHQAFNYRLNIREIKEGWNEIVVYYGHHDPVRSRERNDPVRIVSIELAVQ